MKSGNLLDWFCCAPSISVPGGEWGSSSSPATRRNRKLGPWERRGHWVSALTLYSKLLMIAELQSHKACHGEHDEAETGDGVVAASLENRARCLARTATDSCGRGCAGTELENLWQTLPIKDLVGTRLFRLRDDDVFK
jgi:hypothetical protein